MTWVIVLVQKLSDSTTDRTFRLLPEQPTVHDGHTDRGQRGSLPSCDAAAASAAACGGGCSGQDVKTLVLWAARGCQWVLVNAWAPLAAVENNGHKGHLIW